MSDVVVDVRDLGKSYGGRASLRAVDGVTFQVRRGETLGVVGESGSGKSTLLRMILRLIEPSQGCVLLNGEDVWRARSQALRGLRRQMQAVFQDPTSSFNPRQTIGQILAAPLEVHRIGNSFERRVTIAETLVRVGLPETMVSRFPHQLSGGQKQRVAIARAVILKPRIVLADEPTSALDVSVQAQVLKVFQEIKRDLGLTSIFVSHNLAVIRQVSDHVAVMQHGRLVEYGPVRQIFEAPQSDYTRALINAVPDPFRRFCETSSEESPACPN